jgi:predicted KAP-like P-loop ATPase
MRTILVLDSLGYRMNSKDLHGFASDRPIEKIEEDLLGRSGFSEDLADAISSWHGKDSLVVALHGEWGTGKSSIKNMAISKLNNLNENKPDIVEFSPWEWAAQDKITASFFQEISKSIGRIDKSKEGKKLSATLKKYGCYLNTGESILTGLSAALPSLFILATIVGIGGNFLDEAWVKATSTVILGLLATWAAALKWGKGLLNKLSGNAEATGKEKEQSLSDIRQELTSLLSKRSSSLIVVMDDLDRLTSAQLRMVFQLIKANLEFPKVVFLLLFQRDLVEGKLTDGKQSGRDYLEKIIQVPFDIPKIEVTRLQKLLFNKLDQIIDQDKSAVEMFESDRWGNIFYGVLYAYFDNLRNVYRYTSTLSFHFSLLKGKSAFEVNPVDLMAIECLRIFEPEVYNEIARSKDIFTKNGGNIQGTDTALVNGILDKASEGKRKNVEELVRQLFPTIGGSQYHGSFSKGWLRDMRICHPSNFDKYFQFKIPKGELSNSDLKEMLSLTSDSTKYTEFIISLMERDILKNALSQFESFTDDIPMENGYTYIKALLDIGDKVDHEVVGLTMLSSNDHVMRLVVGFLRRIENSKERGELLLKCFQDSKGISIVKYILHTDESRRNKAETDIILLDYEFERIKTEFVFKLDSMAENTPDQLISHEHFVSFLYSWTRWGDETKVIDWLESQTKNVEGCVNFLKGFVRKASSQTVGSYEIKITSSIKLESIERYLPLEPISVIIKSVTKTDFDNKGQEAIEAFNDAIERREKGIEDEW